MASNAEPLTRPKVIALAIPIMLANAAGPLVGLVDTAVIGQLADETALAAIGLGAVIYGIFYWGFGFLRMSTAGLTAQAVGARDDAGLQAHLARAVPLGLIIGAVIWALQWGLLALLLRIYPSEADVENLTRQYLSIRLWGLPATLAGIALMGWFIGLGRPKWALFMQVVLNAINAALSIAFVLHLDFGVAGVALASVIAEWSGLAAGLAMAAFEIKRRGGLRREALSRKALLDMNALKKLGATNSNIFIRTLAMVVGFQFFAWQAANQGATYLAGNHILLQFINMIALVLDSFAHVAEAAAGAAFGAKSLPRFKRAVRLTTEYAIVFAFLSSAAAFLIGPYVIDLITQSEAVRISAKTYLPYCALVPLAGFAAWQLDGIFIGTTQTAAMRNASIAATGIYIAAHFALFPIFGASGIWLAFLLYYLARAATLAFGYPAILRQLKDPA